MMRARSTRDGAPHAGPAWRGEVRATVALAWPIALTNLLQFALALTDTLLLGRLGAAPLAAATLGVNLYWIAMAPVFGLALAAAPMRAQARGAGQRAGMAGRGWVREMRLAFRQAVWATLLATPAVWLLLWHAEPVLVALGQDPALAALAGAYVRAMMWGIPCFCLFVVLRGFLAALERPEPALWVSVAAIVLNAALGLVLIFRAGLGVVGAGLATSIANLGMLLALALLIRADRQFRRFRLFGRFWRIDRARLAEVCRVGLPIAGTMLLEIGLFGGAALVVGWWGAAAVAAHAIAVQSATMTFMVPLGIGQAATARVGLAIGAGDAAAAARAGRIAIVLGAGFMALAGVALAFGASAIAGAFIDPADPLAAEVVALASVLLMVAALFQLVDGVQGVTAGALRGLKDTSVPMGLAAIGYWALGLPLGLLLAGPLGLGAVGVWFGLAGGLAVVAALMLWRWRVMIARLGAGRG